MRTSSDMHTAARTMRVYRKDQLFRREHEALHTTGLWYVEPITWRSAAPAQRGYPTLHEALSEAQMIEDCERQALSSWSPTAGVPQSQATSKP
jgi:hypothetical protein